MGPSLLSKAPHHIHSPQADGAGPDLLGSEGERPPWGLCVQSWVSAFSAGSPPDPGQGPGERWGGGALCLPVRTPRGQGCSGHFCAYLLGGGSGEAQTIFQDTLGRGWDVKPRGLLPAGLGR